ncbi:MAG: sterol desaturase family protein [Myxococcales bacterium]|nr:sterol desaturase family protein [Myxococcales bacterium]
MDPALYFTLVLSGLHVATLLAVWGVFSLLFARGIGVRFQVAGGKAPDAELLRAAARETLAGQLGFALLVYFAVYPLWQARGGSMEAPLPGVVTTGLHLLVFILANDTIFYWAHRGLHTRYCFQRIHARHHRFRYVRGPVAEYAHPLENAANLVAFFAGPVLMGSPFPVVALWTVVRIFETVEAHSGYAFTASASRHAFHHLYASKGCLGSFFGIWDRLMGTDVQWRAWRKEQPTDL